MGLDSETNGQLEQLLQAARDVVHDLRNCARKHEENVGLHAEFMAAADTLERAVDTEGAGLRAHEQQMLNRQRMESVGLLAGGIAHDFNNILVGILGYASLARDLLEPSHPAQRMLTTIEQSGDRAAALAKELLAYARGGRRHSAPLRLDEQMEQLLNIVATNLPKEAKVERVFCDDLPFITADPTQLQQVMMNICLNAGDAIREQAKALAGQKYEGLIRITTGTAGFDRTQATALSRRADVRGGEYVFLQVADNGCGMDSGTLKRIFEPFFSTKLTGHGLGLAAVDGIIRNHGGFLTVDSTPGQGTTFTVYFPKSEETLEKEEREEAVLALGGPETVLVVDDEEVVRQLVLLTLSNLGYKVMLAADGHQGLDVLRDYVDEVSIVVLDLSMPGMSGGVLLDEFLQLGAKAPVLVTSGYDEDTVTEVINLKRVAGFLQKPYTADVLARAVRTVLDRVC